MKEYQDSYRGTFQNLEYAKQIVSFDGMKFEGRNGKLNVTPTDIDGYIQLDKENLFIFFELKHDGGMSAGQSDALTRLCDAIQASKKFGCIVLLAVHNTPHDKPIIAKDAIVRCAYSQKNWYKAQTDMTLYDTIIGLINRRRKELGI